MKRSLTICLLIMSTSVFSQNFINGDLEGPVGLGNWNGSNLPSWEFVPHTDPICETNNISMASPDVCSALGPDDVNGIFGLPQSGETFVSGSHAGQFHIWHEGIMQNVSGFEIGKSYIISFYQSVVKQSNYIDTSGSWGVYADSVLLGNTTETISNLNYSDVNLGWEYREVTFVATATHHNLKFIPMDLEDGGVRMGIDNIKLKRTNNLQIQHKTFNSIDIKPYPNPFTNQFTLLLDPSLVKSIQMFSLDHKALEMDVNQNESQFILTPLNCITGTYLLKVTMLTGGIYRKKIVAL